MPKISVIIPTYNLCDMVGETINSVLRQTETDLEIIVVDDGSTDNTRQIVEAIADSRVHYFYKDNGGTPSSYNYGFSKANGQYVAFLDHDDLWPKNYIQVMLSALEKNSKFGAAYSPITVHYPDGTKIKSYRRPKGKSGQLTMDIFKGNVVWNSATVIHRSVLENFYFDESLRIGCEDKDYFLRLSTQIKYLFVDEVEAIRREHATNLSKKMSLQPTRILILERFYFRLGGNKIIPAAIARYHMSRACRRVARSHRRNKGRSAAITLYKRALRYWPIGIRVYLELMWTLLLNKKNDPNSNWQMPEPLSEI
ncbi:MAG: glycosyltransferase family 2 protein [Planctomycetes bacterium]|nr:glycosyltransferase family 2 protein [Planctomycetota bacterium]